jgi:hypothetical protein
MPSNDGGERSDASQGTDFDPTDANGARKREDTASAESRSNFLGWLNERFEAEKRAFHAHFDAAVAAQRETDARARREEQQRERE